MAKETFCPLCKYIYILAFLKSVILFTGLPVARDYRDAILESPLKFSKPAKTIPIYKEKHRYHVVSMF